ncbi:hypothetical protein A9Q97_01590 [Rhodospirillales bacterium 47_12_T64]|nr:hypothetical protein A9Q97_01590 [Rhodospirillales bacterium 47_12_T64]
MRHYLINFLLVMTFIFTIGVNPALSAEPNLEQVKCVDIESEDDLASFIFWLDGYISGQEDLSIVDPDEVELVIEETLNTCNEFPEKAVFNIVKGLKQ